MRRESKDRRKKFNHRPCGLSYFSDKPHYWLDLWSRSHESWILLNLCYRLHLDFGLMSSWITLTSHWLLCVVVKRGSLSQFPPVHNCCEVVPPDNPGMCSNNGWLLKILKSSDTR